MNTIQQPELSKFNQNSNLENFQNLEKWNFKPTNHSNQANDNSRNHNNAFKANKKKLTNKPVYQKPAVDNQNYFVIKITGKSLSEIKKEIQNFDEKTLPQIDLDELEKWSIEELAVFAKEIKGKGVIRYRLPAEGGKTEIDTQNSFIYRKNWQQILEVGFEYVQIGLPTCLLGVKKIKPKVLEKPKKIKKGQEVLPEPEPYFDLNKKHPQTKVIISYYNPITCPSYRQLRQLQKRMASFNPEFTKFEVNLKQDHQHLHLLRLVLSKKKNEKILIQSTGLNNTKTNLITLFLGSKINYINNLNQINNLAIIEKLLL
jgi:3-dehydroquinate dehydratase